MKVTQVETLCCDAGWRNYYFVKISTDTGVTGWSEYDEGFGSPGVTAVIEQLSKTLIDQPFPGQEAFYADVYCRTRPAAGGVVAEGIGALENALLDAKAKALGVPCYELLGGKIRVPTLDGFADMSVTAGSTGQRVLRLRGKGVAAKAGAGDLLVSLRIVLPETVPPELEDAARAMREKAPYDPRG